MNKLSRCAKKNHVKKPHSLGVVGINFQKRMCFFYELNDMSRSTNKSNVSNPTGVGDKYQKFLSPKVRELRDMSGNKYATQGV